MCRSCAETGAAAKRCNREYGFTDVESAQRNRVRNLQGALDALQAGDPQKAANSFTHAVGAQSDLDGLPAPAEAPDRYDVKWTIHPDSTQGLLDRVAQLSREREAAGLPPVEATWERVYHPVDGDPLRVDAEDIVYGIGDEESLRGVSMAGLMGGRTRMVGTTATLQVAAATIRLDGKYIARGDDPINNTAAKVEAYFNDGPGSPRRNALTLTQADVEEAANALTWARTMIPTTEYQRKLRHSVGLRAVRERDLGTATSLISAYQRDRARTRTPQFAGQGGVKGGSSPAYAGGGARPSVGPRDPARITYPPPKNDWPAQDRLNGRAMVITDIRPFPGGYGSDPQRVMARLNTGETISFITENPIHTQTAHQIVKGDVAILTGDVTERVTTRNQEKIAYVSVVTIDDFKSQAQARAERPDIDWWPGW